MIDKPICRGLLVCMRTTIGSGAKRLFVSYANNYWCVHETTIGLRANDSYCILVLSLTSSTLSGENFVSLRDIRGEVRD